MPYWRPSYRVVHYAVGGEDGRRAAGLHASPARALAMRGMGAAAHWRITGNVTGPVTGNMPLTSNYGQLFYYWQITDQTLPANYGQITGQTLPAIVTGVYYGRISARNAQAHAVCSSSVSTS